MNGEYFDTDNTPPFSGHVYQMQKDPDGKESLILV